MIANTKKPEAATCAVPLLMQVARGDEGAFEKCVAQYGPLIRFLARKCLGSRAREDVDDAVQEVLLAVWLGATRFNPERGSERAFVTTIAKHRLIDRVRRTAKGPFVAILEHDPIDRDVDGHQDATDSHFEGTSPESACSVLSRIAPVHRHLLELAVFHGKSASEISRCTGLPVGTIKSTIYRTCARLRNELSDFRSVAA